MQDKPSQLAIRVCVIYCFVAGAWILTSDWLLEKVTTDSGQMAALQTYKGWAFVLATGALLYGVLRRLLWRWEQEADERKRGDAVLQLVNRRLRMLSDCSQALVRATDEQELLKNVCQIAVAVGGYRLAWAGFAEADEAKTVRPVAQAGFEAGYLETLKITWADTERGRGPVGIAIRTGEPCAFRNLAEDPSFAPWREEALRRGYASALSLPLAVEGRVFGAFTIYSARSDAFDLDETDLLVELAGDLAFGISALRLRASRQRAEDELRESERKYRELVENANSIILRWTPDGRVLFLNEFGQKFFGYSAGEIFGQSVIGTITPEIETGGRNLRELLGRVSVNPRELEQNINENQRRNGERVWVAWRNKAVLDDRGEVREILSIGSDVTEQRRLEQQLRLAQKMEAIGQLAAGVAHDFNNILCVIQMQSSLILERANPSEEIAESARQISRASERAASLTRQLLAFGRKQFMQPADLNLNEVVANMTAMLERLLGEQIALKSTLAAEPLWLHADGGMLEQVIVNLAVNARDAMPRGGRLEIATAAMDLSEAAAREHPQARTGHFVCLNVTDTGHGIPPQQLPRIFDPFFTTKEVGKGTGLGLATVYGIIQQHHGWIQVHSQLGRGTTFRIFLPAAEKAPEVMKDAGNALQLPGGPETILVVDDEPAMRRLMATYLRRCGYTVLTAVSGTAALTAWKEHQQEIDMLLTDLNMPDSLSGPELAGKLVSEKPRLKVLFTSGFSSETDDGEWPMREGENFLQKPFSARKLTETVRACLDQKP